MEVEITDLDKTLKMLKSPSVSVRYEACEELRVAKESSPETILALEEATKDENEDVAERARQALGAEVHQRMAIKMGKNSPNTEMEPMPELEQLPEQPSRQSARKFNRLAIISLVLGILAIRFSPAALGIFSPIDTEPTLEIYVILFGAIIAVFLLGLTSLITGILAYRQIRRNAMHKINSVMAIMGIVFGYLACLFVMFVILLVTVTVLFLRG